MRLTTPLTLLNRKFNEIDLIRYAMKRRKIATERLHNDYRKCIKLTNLLINIYWNFLRSFGLINQVGLLE